MLDRTNREAAGMTQEEKRALKNKWRAEQNRKFVLSKTNAVKLFRFLGRRIDAEG